MTQLILFQIKNHKLQKIVKNLQEKFPHIPVIYFPKNIGINYENFYETVKPNCLAIAGNNSPGIPKLGFSSRLCIFKCWLI